MAAPSSLSTMHWLASDIYKADVYDNAEDKIGVVTDLIVDNNGNVTTAIVGVGGFLGVGKKEVAVPFKDLKVASRDGKDWLVLNQSKVSYLAPDIVRALLEGRQPIELTPTRLLRLSKDLPHDWSEQRHVLDFAA